MPERMSKTVAVPIWVVVYAIRYGIRRQTYARSDALSLAAKYWNDLDDATRRDVEEECPGFWHPDGYLRARGVVGGTEPAEHIIRRGRGGDL